MQSVGSFTLHPPSTVVGRMITLFSDCLRLVAGPSFGPRVTMKAVHVEGLSFFVIVVSYHTCREHRPANAQCHGKGCSLVL